MACAVNVYDQGLCFEEECLQTECEGLGVGSGTDCLSADTGQGGVERGVCFDGACVEEEQDCTGKRNDTPCEWAGEFWAGCFNEACLARGCGDEDDGIMCLWETKETAAPSVCSDGECLPPE